MNMKDVQDWTKKARIANRFMGFVLWVSLFLALGASLPHVAWMFGRLEFDGSRGNGYLAAVAVDAGIVAITWGIRQRKKAKRKPVQVEQVRGLHWPQFDALWVGVGFLAVISILANVGHGLTAIAGAETLNVDVFSKLDWLTLVQSLVFSAPLPIIVIMLSEIVAADDEKAASKVEREDGLIAELKAQLKDALERLAQAVRMSETAEQARNSAEQGRLNAERSKVELEAQFDGLLQQFNIVSKELNVLRAAQSAVHRSTETNGWHEGWIQWIGEHPGASVREQAEAMGVSTGTASSRNKVLRDEGVLHPDPKRLELLVKVGVPE